MEANKARKKAEADRRKYEDFAEEQRIREDLNNLNMREQNEIRKEN